MAEVMDRSQILRSFFRGWHNGCPRHINWFEKALVDNQFPGLSFPESPMCKSKKTAAKSIDTKLKGLFAGRKVELVPRLDLF